MSDSQVSVGAALGYAWSLWRSHWREIWGALALNALACTVLCAGLFAQNLQLIGLGALSFLATKYAVYGSVMRLAFGGEHPDDPGYQHGALGLQWRRMELRMFGADVLLTFFLAVLAILLGLAIVAPVFAMVMNKGGTLPTGLSTTQQVEQLQQLIGPTGVTIVAVGELVLRIVLLFVIIRLSLYLPATAESGRISIFRTWKLTRGQFWRIFAATLVIGLPTVLIMSVGAGAGLSLNGQPAPLAPGETFFYSLICGGWAGAAAVPLTAGVQAYFYRNLKTDV
jgi:hypothetical protein